MTSDLELLDLAAKAAGIIISGRDPGGHNWLRTSESLIWAPLADDGDALRLARSLKSSCTCSHPVDCIGTSLECLMCGATHEERNAEIERLDRKEGKGA